MTIDLAEILEEGKMHQHIRQYQELAGAGVQFAFQTIMDAVDLEVVAFEALVRGIHGEPAATVISRVRHEQRFALDQACRIRALEAASRNELDTDIHLNCSDIKPGNVDLVCQVTLHMARRYGIDSCRIVLELSNLDVLCSGGQLAEVRKALAEAGLRTLADNFGKSKVDLRPVASFRPEQLKIDRQLVRNIHEEQRQQALVRATLSLARDLNIKVIAAGVELLEEFQWLQEAGVERFQGYFFAQPGLDDGPP